MKNFASLFILCLCIGCAASKNNSTEIKILNGVWLPVKQEFGGKEFPLAIYKDYKLTISDTTYTYGKESAEDKGGLTLNKGKMDIYGREGINTGKHFTAIYKAENGLLTICYNLAGDSYPTDFETASKPTLFLSVYKKE